MANERTNGQRTLVVSGNIDKNSAGEIIDFIGAVNEEEMNNINQYRDYQVKPIQMVLNSTGGTVYDGFAIIGAIECSLVPIEIIHMGLTASMAMTIGVTGHQRIAHRYARFMYHELAYGNIGKLSEQAFHQEEADYIQEQIDAHILERTKITKKKLAEIRSARHDWYFSAKEALELGVVDDIVDGPLLTFEEQKPKPKTKRKRKVSKKQNNTPSDK